MKRLLLLCLSAVMLMGCSARTKPPALETFFAMSTVVDVTVYGEHPEPGLRRSRELVEFYDELLSVTKIGSDLFKINNAKGTAVTVKSDTARIISMALDLCRDTGGAFDISVYPIVSAWGFTADMYRVPEDTEISEKLALVDFNKIAVTENTVTVPEDMMLDLGGGAKGYIGDRIMELLFQLGTESALINIGGNVQTLGVKPDGNDWRIAVRDPLAPEGQLGVVSVGEGTVITSGMYERFFTDDKGTKYHHIINPETGYPANSGLISVTVVGSGSFSDNIGFLSDALSTALFVSGAEKALDYWKNNEGFDLILVTDDNEVIITGGLKDTFTLSDDDKYKLTVFYGESS